jgi:hypothetical protein
VICKLSGQVDPSQRQIYEYRGPAGSDREALAKELVDRYKWIWEHDLRDDVETAIAGLRSQGLVG